MIRMNRILGLALAMSLATAAAWACGDKTSTSVSKAGGSCGAESVAIAIEKSDMAKGGADEKSECPWVNGECVDKSACDTTKADWAEKAAKCPVMNPEGASVSFENVAATSAGSGCSGAKSASYEQVAGKKDCGGAASASYEQVAKTEGCRAKSANFEQVANTSGSCGAKSVSNEQVANKEGCSGAKSASYEQVAKSGCSDEKSVSIENVAKTCSGSCPGEKAKTVSVESVVMTETSSQAVPGGGEENSKAKEASEGKDAHEGHEHAKKSHEGHEKGAYKVGSKVKDFSLTDAVSGETKKLSELAGEKATVLIFWNQECPYVVEAQDRIAEFHKAHAKDGVKVVAIDAGVNNSAESIKKYASEKPFPILVNNDSKIAAKFAATRTPEVFLLNKDLEVVYHGAFDSGQKREGQDRKTYAAEAVNAVLTGEKPEVTETKAFGCSLKYAKGVKPLE